MREGWHDKQIEALTWAKRCRMSYRQIAEITGRTVDACQRMAQRLGLQTPKDSTPPAVVENTATGLGSVTPETQKKLTAACDPTPGAKAAVTFSAPEFPSIDAFASRRTPKAVPTPKRKPS